MDERVTLKKGTIVFVKSAKAWGTIIDQIESVDDKGSSYSVEMSSNGQVMLVEMKDMYSLEDYKERAGKLAGVYKGFRGV